MRRIRFCAIALLIATAVGSASAQEAVRLRYRFREGEKRIRTTTSELRFLYRMGDQGGEGIVREQLTITFAIGPVQADGSFDLRRTAVSEQRITGTPDGPTERKSDQPELAFRLRPTGQLAQPTERRGEINPDDPVGSSLFYLLGQISPLEILPENPVRSGEEWSWSQSVRDLANREHQVTGKGRLWALEGNGQRAWIESENTVPVKMEFPLGGGTVTLTGKLQTRGHSLFSIADGRLLSSSHQTTGDMLFRLSIAGQVLELPMTFLGWSTTTEN